MKWLSRLIDTRKGELADAEAYIDLLRRHRPIQPVFPVDTPAPADMGFPIAERKQALIPETTPMSVLSQTVFDPLKAELGADVGPFVEDFFAELMSAAQKLSGKLSTSTIEGQSGALAINTVVGLASMIGPTIIQSELAKITKSVPAAAAPAA